MFKSRSRKLSAAESHSPRSRFWTTFQFLVANSPKQVLRIQEKFVQIPGSRHNSDVELRIVAIMESPAQTSTVNMIHKIR
jgi:hypothetical protein